jgi:phage terminase large subunit-like protein
MTDWKADLETALRQIPGYNPWDQKGDAWLDHAAALAAINFFFERLKHVEGSTRGQPFELRAWQAAIVGNLFGWKRKDDAGRIVRRYRESLIFVPRGNGKTPLAAGIVAYAFFEDGEPGAQCFLAAGQKEQAGILFRNLIGMVDQEPALSDRVDIFRGAQHRSMTLLDDPLAFCKTIPADAAGQHGGIPHITVIDELHVQDSRDLVDVFETGMSKKVRAQPLLVSITTSDFERESICNEKYAYACRVRDNGGDPAKPGFDPSFLPILYELKPDDDWRVEANWDRANPNLDVSVSRESLRKIVRKATETPALENEVKRLHFNIKTSQAVSLIPMDRWDKCAGTISVDELKGRRCYAGLDLASTEDLASLGLVFPLDDERWAVLSYSWCPADKVAWRSTRKYPYDVWQRGGFIESTDGNQIDYRAIRRRHDELSKLYEIQQLAYDPHGATQFAQDLMQDFGEDYVVMLPQTFRNLTSATKEILRRLKLGKIIHFGNPVLRWAASNVAPHIDGKIPDGGKLEDYLDKVPVIPSKRKSAEKIDPFAAMVDAIALLTQHPEAEGRSVYDTRGVLVL